MSTAILLAAALLAADRPTSVEARFFLGTAVEPQQEAAIEPWVGSAAMNAGSPHVVPYTGWVALSAKFQRLYTSDQGGCIIDGNVTERNGKHVVDIDGCNGGPLDANVTLRPGERRLVKLTDLESADNMFVALRAALSKRAEERAKAIAADVKSFRLELEYAGPQDKPFYSLTVSVPLVTRDRESPFDRVVQVNEEEANEIVDHLAHSGFLDSAIDLRTNIKVPAPPRGYSVKVTTGKHQWYGHLGWDLAMIQRIKGLRSVLPDHGKRDMELLLGRLSGYVRQWKEKGE